MSAAAGSDPCTLAIANGNLVEWGDLSDVAAPGPCARNALTRGLRSVASEPLRRGDAVVGSLCLFAREPGFFEPDVLATLDEVSRSLSFGLDSIALRREREQAVRAQDEAYLRLRAIVDASTSAIWLTDREGTLSARKPALRRVAADPARATAWPVARRIVLAGGRGADRGA